MIKKQKKKANKSRNSQVNNLGIELSSTRNIYFNNRKSTVI